MTGCYARLDVLLFLNAHLTALMSVPPRKQTQLKNSTAAERVSLFLEECLHEIFATYAKNVSFQADVTCTEATDGRAHMQLQKTMLLQNKMHSRLRCKLQH